MAQFVFGPAPQLQLGRKPLALGTGGGYNPLTAIPGLHGYFEARDAASMTVSGGLVSEWRCKVTGFATPQGTVPAQPTLVTPTPGNPRLRFDGVDDCLLGTNHPYPIGTTACEIWLLMAQASLVAGTTQRKRLWLIICCRVQASSRCGNGSRVGS